MSRPALRPRFSGPCTKLVLAAGMSVIHASAMLAFDEAGNEAVIGTFELRSSAHSADHGRPPDRPWAAVRTAGGRDAADPEADVLFNDAMDDLAAGEHESAQRLFERVIARAPESELAANARRELVGLYGIPGGHEVQSPELIESATEVRALQPPALSVVRQPMLPARQAPQPPQMRKVSADTEMQFVLDAGDRVFFSSGSADLGARARGVLAAQARWLKVNPDLTISVEGHADDQPLSAEQQFGLAASRAEAVKARLVAEGVAVERISVTSHGRDQRLADCDKPDCAAQNRRAVTLLSGGSANRRNTGTYGEPPRRPIASSDQGIQAR